MSLFAKNRDRWERWFVASRPANRSSTPSLREFLDSFYSNADARQRAIEERPDSLDAVHDAYVAAVAEHLARVYGLPIPAWSEVHGNGLREPFFAGGLESLKGVLTAESPTAFRRRLLFVSKDALSRPRM
jgi:hypothetical protein